VPTGRRHRLPQAGGGPAHRNGIVVGGSDSISDSTSRQALSFWGSIAVTHEEYGL
jgi:hypothetical protein